jgi:release factor glutamine methyltransferase
MTVRLGTIFNEYKNRLARAQIFSPEGDTRAIFSHVLDLDPEKIGTLSDLELDQQRLQEAEQILLRREKREPLARIFGATTFCGLKIQTASGVFRPCPETEAMVEHALILLEPRKNEALRILDLGTGTGCVLLALLKALPLATGLGVDIDESILNIARANAEANGLLDRGDFRAGIWGEGIEERFDLVVCNPPAAATGNIPYLSPEMRDHDPLVALDGGKDGLSFFRYIVKDFDRLAKLGGLGVFQAYFRNREASIFRRAGLPTEVKFNYLGNPCCVAVINNRRVCNFFQRVKKRLFQADDRE